MQLHYEFGHVWLDDDRGGVSAELYYERSKTGKGFEVVELRKAPDLQIDGIERQLMIGMMEYLKSQLWTWIDSYHGRQFLNQEGIYDVMGFMQGLYGEVFGVDLPDTMVGMANQMMPVNIDALIPGDAVFWGSFEEPNQVAVYLGGGKVMTVSAGNGTIVEEVIKRYNQPDFARTLR